MKRGVWKIGTIEFAVALKALSEGSTVESRVKFLQEAAIMAQFRHSNIVSLYGVISKDEPVGSKYNHIATATKSTCDILHKAHHATESIVLSYIHTYMVADDASS